MARESKGVTALGIIEGAGWFRPGSPGGVNLLPQMLGIGQKGLGNKRRVNAKTIKNISLLLKQDPKAFKEICSLYWVSVNMVRKR